MGNREALLEGARKCLMEKGYAHTTARDIAEAAGVSLAAIGYHFGGKDALMTEVMMGAGSRIGEVLEQAMRSAAKEKSPLRAFVKAWDATMQDFPDRREVLLSLQGVVQLALSAEVGQDMRAADRKALDDLADLYRQADPDATDAECRAVARLFFTLLNGVALLWLVDPESVPTGAQLSAAVGALAGSAG
ncbi:TetR/AcrR family transcriptional regulator [Microlunatus elymi]|uniref:TetR/AcrR family transcriptional regulator n=1 Tax=Microlunatus elymi TaxID=2596828 RepID=A0A516PWL4_9ACTN|nr:TetR/AcrR family transcriptional regulator [Microlunatus elymi]QDP95550.1 TetR/AcrR family transcriptional regulator [Microlunatus elymi]